MALNVTYLVSKMKKQTKKKKNSENSHGSVRQEPMTVPAKKSDSMKLVQQSQWHTKKMQVQKSMMKITVKCLTKELTYQQHKSRQSSIAKTLLKNIERDKTNYRISELGLGKYTALTGFSHHQHQYMDYILHC